MPIHLAEVTGDELVTDELVTDELVTDKLVTLWDLNEAEVPHVNSISLEDFRWFVDNATYFRIAWLDGSIAGFLIALLPGTSYASSNYRWFCARYSNFVYIDRVVVAKHARRFGVGRLLYGDLEAFAARTVPLLTCEVNIRPRNEASLSFHERLGFVNVGTQDTENGTKTVSLMTKQLSMAA